MTDADDVTVFARNELSVTLEGGRIKVGDADGKGGGNVRSKGGDWIRWRNQTGHRCTLVFFEFLAADDDEEPKPTWPFRDPPGQPPNAAVIEAGGVLRVTLRKGGIEGYVKYDVVISAGGGEVARLDPIIIIDH